MERLSKVLSRSGLISRRGAEKWIFEGKVKVNGKVVTVPEYRVEEKDTVTCNGKAIPSKPPSVTYLLHKPKGFLCSNARMYPTQRLVFDLLPPSPLRFFSVGRLDKDTEGLLLITNDGIFKNSVIHPRNNIEREYLLKTNKLLTHEHLVSLKKPLFVEGKRIQAVSVKKVRKNTVKIVVKEGRKHEIRHLAKRADLPVNSLKRIRIGNLRLGNLPKGSFKKLTEKEKIAISS